MENLSKIRTMTLLAIHDKKYGKRDTKITSNYRPVYVYKRNLSMRIGVLTALLLIEALRLGYIMFSGESRFFSMMSKEFVITECIKILIILVIYTLICTVRFRREFDEADERTDEYDSIFETFCKKYYDTEGKEDE